MPPIKSQPNAKRSLTIAVFVFFLALYAATMPIGTTGGDSRFPLLVCQSLVEDGDIYIMNDGLREPGEFSMDTSKFPLVPSLVAVPFYLVGKWSYWVRGLSPSNTDLFSLTSFSSTFVAALTCLLLFRFVSATGFSLRTALLCTCFYGLASIAWFHSHIVATETPSTLGALGAVYAAYRYKIRGSYGWLYLSGFFMGVGIGSRETLMLAVPPLLIHLLITGWQHAKGTAWKSKLLEMLGQLLIFSLGFVPFLIMHVWYTFARYGVLSNVGYVGYGGRMSDLFRYPLFFGLYGLLCSPGRSLFLYCPPLVLLFFSARSFYRIYKAECLLIITIFLTQLLVYSKSNFWEGGYTFGPRYLLPTIPLLFLLIAPFLETLPTRSWAVKVFVLLLFGLGVVVQTTPYWALPPAELYNVDNTLASVDWGSMRILRGSATQYIPLAFPLFWKMAPLENLIDGFYLVPGNVHSLRLPMLVLLLGTFWGAGVYLVRAMALIPSGRDFWRSIVRMAGRVWGVLRIPLAHKSVTFAIAALGLVLTCAGYVAFKYAWGALRQFNSRPFGPMDEPYETYPTNPIIVGNVKVRGWVLDRYPIQAVAVYVDNIKAADATYGQGSPDISEKYAYLPHSDHARYTATVDSSSFQDGTHVLQVKVLNHKGVWTDVVGRAVVFMNQPYDFWQHDWEIQASSPEAVEETELAVGDEWRRVLRQNAGSTMTFGRVPVRTGGWLKLAIGIAPEVAQAQDTDLLLEIQGPSKVVIFSRTIHLKAYAEQPRWLDAQVALGAYQNQVIPLTFSVQVPPGVDGSGLQVGWSNLEIAYLDPAEMSR